VTSGALLDNPPATDAEQAGLFWLSDNGLVGEFLQVRRQVAVLEARSAALLGEIEPRGVPEAEGFGSITGWLVARTGDPAPVCRSRVGVARALRRMPVTREAFAAGELSECRVRLLAAACQFSPEVFCRDEGLLVNQARSLPARLFPQTLAHWRRLADADGALADADRAFERRRLHVSATWGGMVRLDGDLDAESGAVVITALGSLADPAALDPEDRRNPAQRRADALVEICRRHLDCADRPRVGGEKPHLTLTVSVDQLAARGLADLDTGPITLEAVRRLACDATLIPVLTRQDGQPVAAGRRRRVIPPAVRRLLYQRDQHCTHPGCQVPARWCDAHHLTHWAHGGTTEPANLRLLCRRHHRMAHHRRE
jgi:hypothetical protein